MMKLPSALAGLACILPALAWACGACAEDKMAATYDHAVVQAAAAQQQQVVFCDVQGRVEPARLRDAASQVAGVDPASIRTSVEPAAMSFALDTKLLDPDAAAAQIRSKLNEPGVNLVVLKGLAPLSK
jgi:hypothetical protein